MNGKKTALSLAIGSAFAVSIAAAPIAHAAENPFGMSALKSGYMLADASDADKAKEGKCGAAKEAKAKEGKCGDMSAKSKDGMKATDKKMPEGKCGEGKCGGKKKAVDKKVSEGKCGAKKAPEGKCGAKKMDDKAPASGDMK